MKKIVVPVILLLLMLVGCAKTDSMLKDKNLITATCVIREIGDKPLPVANTDNPFFAAESRVFRSYDDLQEYIGRITVCESTEKIIAELKTYDESFFETNLLFYSYEHSTGNVAHEFKGAALTVDSYGVPCVEVYTKTDWTNCIESGATYSYFVSFAKSDVESVDDGSFSIVTYGEQ